MKITNIEPIVVRIPYGVGGALHDYVSSRTMDTLLLRLETDEGLVGWGEGFGFEVCEVTKAAVKRLIVPLAIGQDARDIEGLMANLALKLHNYGRNGPVSYALAALDIALWDVAGQIANKPLCMLLGGKTVDHIPAYASLLRYGQPDLVAKATEDALVLGYRRIKLHEIGEAEVAAARNVIGARADLMVDANCRWNLTGAIAAAKALEKYELLWLEEPIFPPDDFAALRRLKQNSRIAIAAGENAGNSSDMSALIDLTGLDYIQPSVAKLGISEMMKVIELAERANKRIAPHSPYFGPALIATAHINASLNTTPPIERFFCELESNLFDERTRVENGHMTIDRAPGLGFRPDAKSVDRFRVG